MLCHGSCAVVTVRVMLQSSIAVKHTAATESAFQHARALCSCMHSHGCKAAGPTSREDRNAGSHALVLGVAGGAEPEVGSSGSPPACPASGKPGQRLTASKAGMTALRCSALDLVVETATSQPSCAAQTMQLISHILCPCRTSRAGLICICTTCRAPSPGAQGCQCQGANPKILNPLPPGAQGGKGAAGGAPAVGGGAAGSRQGAAGVGAAAGRLSGGTAPPAVGPRQRHLGLGAAALGDRCLWPAGELR
jgi:hypothetical protein